MNTRAKERLSPLNDSLNKPKTILGLDFQIAVAITVLGCLVFLCASKVVGILIPTVAFAFSRYVTRKDPKRFSILANSFLQPSLSDPGKE